MMSVNTPAGASMTATRSASEASIPSLEKRSYRPIATDDDASDDHDSHSSASSSEQRLQRSLRSMFEAFANNLGIEFKVIRLAQEATDRRVAALAVPTAAAAEVLSHPGAHGITQVSSATVFSPPTALGIASLPDRLRAADFRSTSSTDHDMFHAFLTDAAHNPHYKQKAFQSRDEFYEHIMPTVRNTASSSQFDNHRQLIDMITLMSKIESQLGWTAADAYWWRVQAEVRQSTHAFLTPGGAAMCAGVYASLFHEFGGRHRSAPASTGAAAAAAPAKRKAGTGTAGQCIHHPHSTTHTTATCRAASGGTGTEGKHA
jgi:DNA-binding FadR family transcriptional regulator